MFAACLFIFAYTLFLIFMIAYPVLLLNFGIVDHITAFILVIANLAVMKLVQIILDAKNEREIQAKFREQGRDRNGMLIR